MSVDVLIKNGTVIDGSGSPRFVADVAINEGKIVGIGRLSDKADQTIDAEGQVVSPGFVDGHTHMDAQIFWDPLGASSCYHGVTSVVMGNCGFTLAPCAEAQADFVFRNLERAEDISREAMLKGITWGWETYPQFMDAIEALPKGINYAGYIGHSALRTHVMGERAFTSRTPNHITADDRPVASRVAEWSEVEYLVKSMGTTGKGIFELAGESPGRNPDRVNDYLTRLKNLAVESGVPQTWGMFSTRLAPDLWRPYFDLLHETNAAGGRMFAQVHTRALNTLLSFATQMPFDTWDVWKDLRALPLDEQKVKLQDAGLRARLVEVASQPYTGPKVVGVEARPPDWDWLFIMDSMLAFDRFVA